VRTSFQQSQQINPVELQRARQEAERGQITLGQERQKDLERRNLQEFFANPENFQTNGRIDLDKINKVVPTIAQFTGSGSHHANIRLWGMPKQRLLMPNKN